MIIICGTICCKYEAAVGMVRHFLILCNKKDKVHTSFISRLAPYDRYNIEKSV